MAWTGGLDFAKAARNIHAELLGETGTETHGVGQKSHGWWTSAGSFSLSASKPPEFIESLG